MSAREWKPGDFAMVHACPVGYEERTGLAILNRGHCWDFNDGAMVHKDRDDLVVSARPVVVIDPEDREQVERMVVAYAERGMELGHPMPEHHDDDRFDAMQAALRSLIAPPKPDEPQGLGAVVEDQRDDLWVRVRGSWFCGMARLPWSEIAAVRVLSEGVTR